MVYQVVYPNQPVVDSTPVIMFFPGKKGGANAVARMMQDYSPLRTGGQYIGWFFTTPDGGWNESHAQQLIPSGRRHYAYGFSNGAVFALMLSNIVTKIVAVSGSAYSPFQPINCSTPVLMINGVLDRSVPYAGGYAHKVQFWGAPQTFSAFTAGQAQDVTEHTGYTITSVANGSQLYSIANADHGVLPYMKRILNINYVALVMDFFL